MAGYKKGKRDKNRVGSGCLTFLFRPFLEAVEIICLAGLLTYFRIKRLPILLTEQWQKYCLIRYEAYSSGTVWDFHPIPF